MPRPVRKAVEWYVGELRRRFPSVQTQVMPEAMGGFDVWIRVAGPEDRELELVDATAELAGKSLDQFDVSILATVVNALDGAEVS